MIKASDLRIGNFISDDEGVLAKVTGFNPFEHSIRCDEPEGCHILVDCYHTNGARRTGCETDSPECNPIPLTPEWLERCGFVEEKKGFNICYKRVDSEGYSLDFLLLWRHEQSAYYELGREHDGYLELYTQNKHKILHLHHLQNLYYALTGEELNVKL